MASTTAENPSQTCNVAGRLVETAQRFPDSWAVVEPGRVDALGRRPYDRYSFRRLDQESDRLARGLLRLGIEPGTRLALMAPPSFRFVALVFAFFKAGAVGVLIDPGMGVAKLLACLDQVRPQGFVAVSLAQAVRAARFWRFRESRCNVTLGRRWFWSGPTYEDLLGEPWDGPVLARTAPDDLAAIIFTTGSTGPAKGVAYRHGNFDAQVDQLREFYDLRPGAVDLACFPLFGLFNAALAATTVIPILNPSRPGSVDPRRIIEAVTDCGVTQSFGSPAIWDRVGRYCEAHRVALPTLENVFSAGAPVQAEVLRRMKQCLPPEARMHTPYGATEALPVASIEADEALRETWPRTQHGAGICVGRRFSGIEWRVVRIVDGPLPTIADVEELPPGEIGELIVSGPVVTREYYTLREANAGAKIADGPRFWHRMGDVGYLDVEDRFWFCGRMAHRVVTPSTTLFTISCEAIFNRHPAVRRTALVGLGPRGRQTPALIVEPTAGAWPRDASTRRHFVGELRELARPHPHTAGIEHFLFHRSFPVDIRHNAKIFREKLAVWAASRLPRALSA